MQRFSSVHLTIVTTIFLLSNCLYTYADMHTYKIEGVVLVDSHWDMTDSTMVGYFTYSGELPVHEETIYSTSYRHSDWLTEAPDIYFQLYFQDHAIYSSYSTGLTIYDEFVLGGTYDLFDLFTMQTYSPTLETWGSGRMSIYLRDNDHSIFESTQIPTELPSYSEFEYSQVLIMDGSFRVDITSLDKIHNGDLNGDGFVGLDDLDIVLNNWNQDVILGDRLIGDASNDGYVGLDDLDIVLNDWNAATPPAQATIPEPTTTMLLTTAAFSLLNRRRNNHPAK